MLSLGFGGLEGAGENEDLSISHFLFHLGMREVFINDNSSYEGCVFETAAGLSDDLDVIEVNVAALEIGNRKNGFYGNVCHMILALADDLGAESSCGAFTKELVVILLNVNLLLNGFNSLNSNVTSTLESICYLEGVNTLIEKLLSLIEKGASENNNTGSAISNFVVLRLGKLDKKAGSLVLDLHLFNNRGTVVGNDNISIRAEIYSINQFYAYLTSILSIPLGPREVLISWATVLAARMLA